VNGETWIRYGLNRGSHLRRLALSLSLSGIDLLACASFSLLAPLLVISRFPSLSLSLSLSLSPFCFYSLCHAKLVSLNFVSRSVEFGFLDLTLLSGKFQAW
jgi:hypothetical protein